MVLRTAALALFLVAPSSALARTPSIPKHVVRNIRLTVLSADAVVLATVSSGVSNGTVELAINETLKGQVAGTVRVPAESFFPGDLEPGVQVLAGLKADGQGAWTGTGRYDRVFEHRIRDIATQVYLERTSKEIRTAELAKQRQAARAERRARLRASHGRPAARPQAKPCTPGAGDKACVAVRG